VVKKNIRGILMGVYGIYGKMEIQLKVGDTDLTRFNVGDKVNLSDGIYLGFEGAVIIKDGIFIAEFDTLTSKWGDLILPSAIITEYNPVNVYLNQTK
jgi:hypothetical protein